MRNKPARFVRWVLFLTLSLPLFPRPEAAAGQGASQDLTGSWMASTGEERYFRGTWSAEISAQNRNAARGSWTLLGDGGDVVMEGTWSARKAEQGWQGSWTARISKGGSLSGSWSADLAAVAGKTMEEMLNRTNQKQVAGSWQSGRYQGYWWLDGTRAKAKRK
jgi:hypothetical protein